MLPTSPLLIICHTIEQVRSSADTNAGIFQKNEAATRAALIDPMLRALGWDTTNVRMVEPEHTVENKQSLDYVLRNDTGGVSAVIEAKKLGERLDKLGHVGALIGYAFSLKPQSFFITDGLNWHCYSPKHSHYQPVATLNLREAPLIDAALQLVQWLDAALSGHGTQAIVHEKPGIAPASSKATAKPPKSVSKPQEATLDFLDLNQLNLAALPIGQKPRQLRLPNGTVKPVTKWKDILVEVSRLLLATNTQLTVPLPDKAKKKRFLISWEKQPVGASTALRYQGKTVFVGTNYSARVCLANAIYAAQFLPANQQTATLAIRF